MNEELSTQILAMGFPSVRIMLLALSKYFNKEYVNPKIEEICHIQDVGFLNADYFDKKEDKRCNMLFFLKECQANHDLTIQLDKLKCHLDEDKWKDVLKSLSSLILLARNIYSIIYDHNKDLIQEIVGIENIDQYSKLQVDESNTTLYLPNIDTRVGIFFEKV